jgi:hypothetical protein
MDEGLIQFLVIAFFIIVSIMDGAARKRRKAAQSLGHPPEAFGIPEADDDSGEEPWSRELSSRSSEGPARTSERVAESFDGATESATESAEGIVPEDLWQEIAALARGQVPAPRRGPPQTRSRVSRPARPPDTDLDAWTEARQEISQPEYVPLDEPTPTPSPPEDLQAGYLHADQAVTHREHAQVARRVPPLPAEPHEFVPHSAELPGGPQAQVRRTPKSGSLQAGVMRGTGRSLREAIVLSEVLNLPLALRDSDRELPGGD